MRNVRLRQRAAQDCVTSERANVPVVSWARVLLVRVMTAAIIAWARRIAHSMRLCDKL